MDNKLQQLTQKLYDEGLEKGRTEAERLVTEARTEAHRIIDEANREAERVVAEAKQKARDVAHNADTEISQAGRQAIAKLKEQIASMIVTKAASGAVSQASLDPEFVKTLILEAVKGDKNMTATLPKGLESSFAAAAKELMDKGIEVGYSNSVKSGFKIAPKDGSYYISFTDTDFDALLKSVLRDKVFNLLYRAE